MRKHLNLHNILSGIALVILLVIIFINRHQFGSFWHLISHIRWYILLVIVAVQLLSYYLNACYYQSILKVIGHRVGKYRLFEAALASNFVNYILPSAGMAGAGYLSQVLSPEIPRGVSFLVQLLRYAFGSLATLIMLPLGLGLLLYGNFSDKALIKSALIASLAVLIFAIVVIYAVYQEQFVRKNMKRLARRFKGFKRFNEQAIDDFTDEFYTGFNNIKYRKLQLTIPIIWSIVYIAIEIATFYLAFVAFGRLINPGIAIMGYFMANIASLVGGVIISTGIFELSMVGALVVLGQPFALALSTTITYRVMNMIVGLPPGFGYYRRYLPKKN